MAFIERAMHWGSREPDTDPPAFEPEGRYLPVHDIFAGMMEIVYGRITAAQFKLAVAATLADTIDLDALAALAPAADAGRARFVNSIHSVLILAEGRWPGYDTPAAVRLKLGI